MYLLEKVFSPAEKYSSNRISSDLGQQPFRTVPFKKRVLTTDICSVHIFERKSSTRVLNSDQAALPVETYISRSRPQYTMAVLVFYISGSR